MTRPTLILMLLLPVVVAPAAAQRPWLTTAVWGSTDDQPRTALHGRLEAGRSFGPNATLGLSFEAARYTADPISGAPLSLAHTTTRPGLSGSIGIPSARLGLAAEVTRLSGVPREEGLMLWNVRPSIGLGAGVALRAKVDRDRYTATVASLDTTVLRTGYELSLDRSAAPGWAGAATWRREDFGDANAVTTISAWLLAPLSQSTRHSIRAGYAFGWQDAAESRWVVRQPGAVPPVSDPVEGAFDPYYTPHDQRVHSIAADAAIAAGRGWVSLNGAVALVARELAPEYRTPGGGTGPTLLFVERDFRPWRAAAAFTVPTGATTWLALSAEHQRTAYWSMTGGRLSLTHTF